MKRLLLYLLLYPALPIHAQEEPRNFQKSLNRFKIGTDIARGNPSFNFEHMVGPGASIEMGFGLTFDDFYAINNWDGHQYIERNNSTDTRYSFSFGVNFLPIPKVSFLYMGFEGKYRKYYSSDDYSLHSSGMFLGAKRSETTFKFKVGNLFQSNRVLIDYSAGIGYMVSNDEWGYFANINPQDNYTKGEGAVQKLVFSFELKIGLGGKRTWE